MKNNLSDVNNYLFEELERLNDDENLVNEENFKKEIQRAKAVSSICSTIVSNANFVLKISTLTHLKHIILNVREIC